MIINTTLGELDDILYAYRNLLGESDGVRVQKDEETMLDISCFRIQIPSLKLALREGFLMYKRDDDKDNEDDPWEIQASISVICEIQDKDPKEFLGWATCDGQRNIYDYLYPQFNDIKETDNIPCFIDTSEFIKDEKYAKKLAKQCEKEYKEEMKSEEKDSHKKVSKKMINKEQRGQITNIINLVNKLDEFSQKYTNNSLHEACIRIKAELEKQLPQQKIGEFVKENITKLAINDKISEGMLHLMQSSYWSKTRLHLPVPFAIKVKPEIDSKQQRSDSKGHVRYWEKPFSINNKQYFLCKEWYENQKKYFQDWMNTKVIKCQVADIESILMDQVDNGSSWDSLEKDGTLIELYPYTIAIPDLKLVLRMGVVYSKADYLDDLEPGEYETLSFDEKYEFTGSEAYVLYSMNDEFDPQNYLLFEFYFRGLLFFLENVYNQWDPAKRPAINGPVEDLPCEIIFEK